MKLWSGQTVSFFGSALTRLALPLLAIVALEATPAEMGLLTAVETAPVLLIGLFAGVWVGRYRRRNLLIAGDVGRALLLGSLEVLPAVFATPLTAIPLLLSSSFLGNLGWVLYNVNAVSVRQAITPLELQGRMNATLRFLVAGMLPLGALAGGALGGLLGLRETIALAAGGSVLASLWVVFSPVRRLSRMEDIVPLAGEG
jgi:hypothetical protein